MVTTTNNWFLLIPHSKFTKLKEYNSVCELEEDYKLVFRYKPHWCSYITKDYVHFFYLVMYLLGRLSEQEVEQVLLVRSGHHCQCDIPDICTSFEVFLEPSSCLNRLSLLTHQSVLSQFLAGFPWGEHRVCLFLRTTG